MTANCHPAYRHRDSSTLTIWNPQRLSHVSSKCFTGITPGNRREVAHASSRRVSRDARTVLNEETGAAAVGAGRRSLRFGPGRSSPKRLPAANCTRGISPCGRRLTQSWRPHTQATARAQVTSSSRETAHRIRTGCMCLRARRNCCSTAATTPSAMRQRSQKSIRWTSGTQRTARGTSARAHIVGLAGLRDRRRPTDQADTSAPATRQGRARV